MIRGLLIEGTDYAGKTTVCSLVAAALQARGVATHVGHCYVHDATILDHFLAEAKKSTDLLQIDWYYTANILLDLGECRRRLPEAFVVQDRHWLSQVGRNEFFHASEPRLPTRTIWDLHLPFEHNFYLASDLVTKRARSALRPAKSVRDRYLRENPERHQQYDEFLRHLLPEAESWTVIDTSPLTPAEVASRIVDHVTGDTARCVAAPALQ
ncbi:MAG TPA: hypothetical protein VGL81_32635 [Polyangiaceae bacterium]|jgi:thymidylate kinase